MLQSKIDIGKFDVRITFQTKVITTNVSNEDEETGWSDFDTVWANKEDLWKSNTGNEEYRSDRLTTFMLQVFHVRYRSDLDTKMRIMDNGVPYNITAIAEVSRKRFLKITAASGLDYI